MATIEKTGNSRVWVFKWQAGPSHSPEYLEWAKGGSPDWGLGDITRIQVPSKNQFGAFDEAGTVRGQDDRPTMGLTLIYPETKSAILDLVRLGCPIDIQLHFGRCGNPTNYAGGWEKILVFENASFTNYSLGDLGAFESSENAKIDETVDVSAEWFYEVLKMQYGERAASDVGQEIVGIAVYKTIECGGCDNPTDGKTQVFAVSAPFGTSPGVLPEIVFTDDGYVTSGDTWITTATLGQNPSDIEIVGDKVVVIFGGAGNALHYADKQNILDGLETWTKVTTGFVAAKGPNAMTAASAADVWMAGNGGYIYYTTDPTTGVTVQDAGNATTQNLNDIHAYNMDTVVAVGAANTVVYTNDGQTWALVTGPDTVNTPDLNCVFCRGEKEWWVGTADNAMWVTENAGISWTQVRFSGDTAGGAGTGNVWDIQFATYDVGFMSHATAANLGRIFRSTDGGRTWVLAPEKGTMPAADKFNAIATVYKDPNIVYLGGLADNGGDGIIVKGYA